VNLGLCEILRMRFYREWNPDILMFQLVVTKTPRRFRDLFEFGYQAEQLLLVSLESIIADYPELTEKQTLALSDYEESSVEATIIGWLHLNEFEVSGIASFAEVDTARCARLAGKLNLPFVKESFAVHIEDKYEQRRLIQQHAPELNPDFTSSDAAKWQGQKLVFKLKKGFGSKGLRLCRSEFEFAQAKAELSNRTYFVEQFVSDNIYHVDGIFSAKGIVDYSISKYIGKKSYDYKDPTPRGSVSLVGKELRAAVLESLDSILSSVVVDNFFHPFHIEIFDIDSTPKICEINFRTGGSFVRTQWELAKGYQIEKRVVQLNLGLPWEDKSVSPCKIIASFGIPGNAEVNWGQLDQAVSVSQCKLMFKFENKIGNSNSYNGDDVAVVVFEANSISLLNAQLGVFSDELEASGYIPALDPEVVTSCFSDGG